MDKPALAGSIVVLYSIVIVVETVFLFLVLAILTLAVGVVAWLAINTGGFPAIKPIDPWPFPILDLMLSFESILLASFILMRQSRIARRSEERNHLELQLMLLTEKELTATLGVCREIAKRLGLGGVIDDHEIKQLAEEISVDQMAESIREKLSEK